jgi:hypothetical protein
MKIKCTKCGDEKGVRKDVYEARVTKFGSEKKLLDNYLCQKCRPKKVKASKADKEKNKEKKSK